MIGIDLVKDKQTKAYAGPERDRVVDLAFERGLLILGAGPSAIRLCPPLIVNKAEADAALEILEECIGILEQEHHGTRSKAGAPTGA